MNDIQSSFARTINERHLGVTAASMMTDCEHYGITYGCTVNCPVLMRGECELMHDENAELYAECVREHSFENRLTPSTAMIPEKQLHATTRLRALLSDTPQDERWVCSSCGDKTSDISPLGPVGVIICEECANPNNPTNLACQYMGENVKAHTSLTEGELRSEQDSALPQPPANTAGQGLCDATCPASSSVTAPPSSD